MVLEIKDAPYFLFFGKLRSQKIDHNSQTFPERERERKKGSVLPGSHVREEAFAERAQSVKSKGATCQIEEPPTRIA
jgi:hypothetical protein